MPNICSIYFSESNTLNTRRGRVHGAAALPALKVKGEEASRSALAIKRRQIPSQRESEYPAQTNATDAQREKSSMTGNKSMESSSSESTKASEALLESAISFKLKMDVNRTVDRTIIKTNSSGTSSDWTIVNEDSIKNDSRRRKVVATASRLNNGNSSSDHQTTTAEEPIKEFRRRKQVHQKSSPLTSSSLSSALQPTSKNHTQKLSAAEQLEMRRRNTVSMPDALYHHFSPVDSSIPMEDMNQFLHFGQKIQSSTSSNAIMPNQPRRADMTRLMSTQATHRSMMMAADQMLVGQLEDNNIAKSKSTLLGMYYGKMSLTESRKNTSEKRVDNQVKIYLSIFFFRIIVSCCNIYKYSYF